MPPESTIARRSQTPFFNRLLKIWGRRGRGKGGSSVGTPPKAARGRRRHRPVCPSTAAANGRAPGCGGSVRASALALPAPLPSLAAGPPAKQAVPARLQSRPHLERLRREPRPEARQEHPVGEYVVDAAARQHGQRHGREQLHLDGAAARPAAPAAAAVRACARAAASEPGTRAHWGSTPIQTRWHPAEGSRERPLACRPSGIGGGPGAAPEQQRVQPVPAHPLADWLDPRVHVHQQGRRGPQLLRWHPDWVRGRGAGLPGPIAAAARGGA
jgi:hypothetical protein